MRTLRPLTFWSGTEYLAEQFVQVMFICDALPGSLHRPNAGGNFIRSSNAAIYHGAIGKPIDVACISLK